MSKHVTTYLVAAALAAALLAIGAGAASASTAASASAKQRVVTIAMHDPGCHWFSVAGTFKSKLAVQGKTAFRNLDEAPLVFTGKHFRQRLAVGKLLSIATPGTYHITMVGQAPDDNHLLLVVK